MVRDTQSIKTPQHQIFDVGVKALIFQDDCLLLLKRHDHSQWEMPGGRINVDETIEQALLRELAEELPGAHGFIVRGIVHAQQADFMLPNGHRLLLLFFEVESQMPCVINLSAEHDASAWLSPTEFAAMGLQPQTRAAGEAAFQRRAHNA